MEVAGLLVVDKPPGPTSHDVVDAVRRVARVRRVGHTGTLDPAASGVLVVCVGPATRLAEFLTGHDKGYRATVRFGVVTDSDDAEGDVVAERPAAFDPAALRAALRDLTGEQMQRPPAYSAKRVAGQKGTRAYELARRGTRLDLPPRPVRVDAFELLSFDAPFAVVDVQCSAGTYVRALARDLGERLGCGAHLAELRRTRSGPFTLVDAVALADLEAAADWRRHLRPVRDGLPDWPAVVLDDLAAARVRAGLPVPRPQRGAAAAAGARWLGIDPAGQLVAVLAERGADLHPAKVLG